MSFKLRSIEDVVARQLCCGCGACAYAWPHDFEMIDSFEYGRRPRPKAGSESKPPLSDALAICPGVGLAHTADDLPAGLIADMLPAWGPILEVWEGYAAAPELRFAASSGGAASALALHAIERRGLYGLLHIKARPDIPYLNETVLSRSRAEIMAATGSRYAPASPCDGLQRVEDAPTRCVFIGKPCDVAGAAKARRLRPRLDENLGLMIAIFCAGTPSLKGTVEMLRQMGVSDLSAVRSVRYRGRGWPGKASVVHEGADGQHQNEMSYAASWGGILHRYRPWRCHICADHTGEFADIAVGDPWYREVRGDEPGRSLIVVRNARGAEALRAALDDGYLEAERVPDDVLPKSQPDLLRSRGAIWGRIWTLRLLGLPAPLYSGMPMFRFWMKNLSLADKARSLLGTLRRARSRNLAQRIDCQRFDPPHR